MLKNLPWCSWTPPSRYPSQHWRFVAHSSGCICPPSSTAQTRSRTPLLLLQHTRYHRHRGRSRRRCTSASTDKRPEPPGLKNDEPEAAVLLVACAIGLVTGGGVVLFNNVIHSIRHLAFQETPVEATHWGRWARQLPLPAEFTVLVAPPLVGGIVVGSLRALTQFDKPGVAAFSSRPVASNPLKGPARGGAQPSLASSTGAAAGDHAEAGLPALPSSRQQRFTPLWGKAQKARLQRAASPVLRALAAAITLGSGASLGPEGPSVDIGRSSARALGSLLRSKHRRLFPLIAAGSGAGVAAGFNAPISGVFFAVESVLQKPGAKDEFGDLMDSSVAANSSGLTIAMVLLSSVVAAVVSQAGLGASPAFRVPEYQLQSTFELPLVLVLGALCGLVAAAFRVSSQVSDSTFTKLQSGPASKLPQQAQDILWPTLGGLGTGLIALAYPEVLYQGFGNVNAILEARGSDYAPAVLLQIVAAKVVTTSICQRSGLVGGIYAPSIFMGAALGSAFGGIASVLCTPLGLDVTAPQAYALVGVAGMLAALCQLPLTAVLLLFELTHDYFIIIPTLASVGISYWVASFPLASVLEPLSPLSRLLPSVSSSAGSQARSPMTDEISSAVSDALTDTTPLGRDEGLLESTAQRFVDGEESSFRQPESGEESFRQPNSMQRAVGRVVSNGLMQGGDSGSYGRRGRGLTATVSFSGSRPPSNALPASHLNGSASAAPPGSSAGGSQAEEPVVGGLPLSKKAQEMDNLSVLCALRQSCVMLTPETSLVEALEVLDEAEETVALVLDADGALIGVLTKASVVEAISASKATDIASMSQ